MKTRRLSEIDLARLAAITDLSQLERALRAYNSGGGAWSYDPVRASTSDIFAATTPLLGRLASLPWEKIERQIIAASKRGEIQADANVRVGKVLFDATKRLGWTAVQFHMGRMPIGIGETVRYWSDMLLADEDGPFIPFFDHRRDHGIDKNSVKQIVFSFLHTWVRERHPDLLDARLAIIQFPSIDSSRTIHVEFLNELSLLSYEELNDRVCLVYETWSRISREKIRDVRKTGTDDNPFGF